MSFRGTFPLLILAIVLLAAAGCTQPARPPVPASVSVYGNDSMNITPVGVPDTSAVIADQPGNASGPKPRVVITNDEGQNATPATPAIAGGFTHCTTPDYSFDYPASWRTNISTIPLREYRHSSRGCDVTFAYNLDQELRMYYSPDGSTLFYSSIVNTDRNIWPRNEHGQVAYDDIANSILGTPDFCAGTPVGTFTISGIAQVPLPEASYTGVRADFGKLNATSFTEGTGTEYIVTGKHRQGVFTFYSTSKDTAMQATLSQHMFNGLQISPDF
jgi:hypothetical protein